MAGGGLANMFGGGGGYEMSPRQKKRLRYVEGELAKPDEALGYDRATMNGLLLDLKEAIDRNARQGLSSGVNSMARRGTLSSGALPGMTADIMGQTGKNYAEGFRDFRKASLDLGRQRRSALEQELGQIPEIRTPEVDFGGLFGELGDLYQQYKGIKNLPPISRHPRNFMGAYGVYGSGIRPDSFYRSTFGQSGMWGR